jgi:pyruvate dehydrogenase E2 component (dihydrolipoamide acetyltransferase)
MPIPVIMPKLEMAQESARVVEWLKADGERVEKGEALLTVETDKVTVEVESPGSGILAGRRGGPGEVIPVTKVIAYLLQAGETLASRPSASAPEPPPALGTESLPATPLARRVARANGIDVRQVSGSGPAGKVTRADVSALLTPPELPAAPGNGELLSGEGDQPLKPRATPAARRLARAQELDLGGIPGSGPRGRVQARDVENFSLPGPLEPEEEILPLEGMRRTIAERLQASYQTAPHIHFSARVDTTQLEAVRAQLNRLAEARGEAHVSVTAVLVKTVAWALGQHPWLNSSLREDGIHLLKRVHLGVAVALPEGLIVPVIRDSGQKGIGGIAAELKEKTERARLGKLTLADVSGGTFTLSNLGPFGIEEFTAILNPGQTGILAVGAAQAEPVVVGDQIVIRRVMHLNLAVDHRVVDGAQAAQFMATLKSGLENPALMLW